MANKKHIHRGEVLKKVVSDSGMSIKEIAKRAKLGRTTYYRHIENADLSYKLLEVYGTVLKHDFSAEFPEMDPDNYLDTMPSFKEPKTLPEAKKQIEYWRRKYIQVLEKYNSQLEK